MQVGGWAPTQRLSKRNSTGTASWGVGPNIENFEKKFDRQCKLGGGPQHREFRKELLQAMQVGVWAPTKRNWIPNFYRQCKLGCGPQHREFRQEILQAMQVGVRAPTKRNWIPQFYRQCTLGWDNEINFAKISFLSHSHVCFGLCCII